MMIPQIARKLLAEYGTEGGWLLDPYCGTGTSLVEASLFGMHSVGCDINPLVRLIATAKSTPICLSTLDETLNRLNDPSNIAGKTATTMHEENIVICQRTTHT